MAKRIPGTGTRTTGYTNNIGVNNIKNYISNLHNNSCFNTKAKSKSKSKSEGCLVLGNEWGFYVKMEDLTDDYPYQRNYNHFKNRGYFYAGDLSDISEDDDDENEYNYEDENNTDNEYSSDDDEEHEESSWWKIPFPILRYCFFGMQSNKNHIESKTKPSCNNNQYNGKVKQMNRGSTNNRRCIRTSTNGKQQRRNIVLVTNALLCIATVVLILLLSAAKLPAHKEE